MDNTPKYFAPSVDAASRVLKYLSRYKTMKSTLTEVSEALEINKSSCLRVLKTLEYHNLVHYDETSKRYSLGVFSVVLGSRAQEGLEHLAYIKSFLQEATQRTKLTSALVQQMSKDRLMFVSKEDTTMSPYLTVSIGNRFPIMEVSYGKWYLAYSPDEIREEMLSSGLKQVTPNTITNREQYLAQLDQIKDEGVLVSNEEYTNSITAISTAVIDDQDNVMGVIAVIGIASLMDEERINEVSAIMKEIGAKASMKFKSHPLKINV